MKKRSVRWQQVLLLGVVLMLAGGCGESGDEASDTSAEETVSGTVVEEAERDADADAVEEEIQEEAEMEAQVLEAVQPLKECYADDFVIGMCLNPATIGDYYTETVVANFNSVTCENEMKPDAVLDHDGSLAGVAEDAAFVAVDFSRCQNTIAYCLEHEIPMRLHTLVWHAQTPEWFFHVGYDTHNDLVDADTMAKRMENYIHAVISYFDTTYPGLIYTIDVVNEAFNGNGDYGVKETENRWYDTMGYTYVYHAFLYAREAIEQSETMQDVTLVYNDYGMMHKTTTVIEGLAQFFTENGKDVHDYVDAIGMQGHLDTNTSMRSFISAARMFGNAGYEVQVTELDIGIPEVKVGAEPDADQLETQGRKYRYLMEGLRALKQEGVRLSGVSVWGISDDNSWRKNNDGFDAHALLFDSELVAKPAYRGMALAPEVISYYTYGLDF